MSNTSGILLLLVKWEAFGKRWSLTYISEKVGHTDLSLGMEVKVTYMSHMSFNSLHKRRNMPPFIGYNALKTEFDLYFHKCRSQRPNSSYVGQCGLEMPKMSNTCEFWPLLVKWEVILEKRVLTYISEKVGHSDLILSTGVKVTYMCHISHANLKSIEKCKNVPPFTD